MKKIFRLTLYYIVLIILIPFLFLGGLGVLLSMFTLDIVDSLQAWAYSWAEE